MTKCNKCNKKSQRVSVFHVLVYFEVHALRSGIFIGFSMLTKLNFHAYS